MRKKIKVLHIVPGFNYGGIEKRLLDWFSLLDRELIQFDVVKVTPNEPNILVDELRSMGGEVFSLPPLGVRTSFSHISCVDKLIRKGKYDVVHSHSLAYSYFPLKQAYNCGCRKRIIHSRTTEHNPGEHMLLAKNYLGRKSLKYATDFFACSQEAGRHAFGYDHEFRVIDNGIFLQDYIYKESVRIKKRDELGLDKSLVLGYVGRFSPQKNIPMLFEIFGKVHSILPSSKLLIVGDAQDDPLIYDQAMQISERYGTAQDIIYAGRQDYITDWLSAMDILLMPSLFEGFGTVAIEAQANGLPCLLSDRIPRNTEVSDEVCYLPLEDINAWVNAVIKWKQLDRKEGDIKRIADAGYDVHSTARWLQDFYLS